MAKKTYTDAEAKAELKRRREKDHRNQKKYLSDKWQPTTTCPESWRDLVTKVAGAKGTSEYMRKLIEADLKKRGLL